MNSPVSKVRRAWQGGLVAGLAVCAAAAGGCGDGGPSRSTVSGSVRLNGEPIDDGRVSLLPLAKNSDRSYSAPIVGGRYAFEGENQPPLGNYRVEIEGYRKTGRTIRNLASPERNQATPPTVEERLPIVPPEFNLQSEISIEVTAEPNQHDFDLTTR